MYCWKCGKQLTDGSAFCALCGARLTDTAQPEHIPEPDTGRANIRKPEKKQTVKRVILILSICAAAAALAIIITGMLRSGQYDHAAEIMASDPLKAKAEFQSLGDYKDSEYNAELCEDIYDYGAAADLMGSGNYEDAMKAFLKLGNYSDSVDRARECRNFIDYDKASRLMAGKDFSGAYDIFIGLAGFKDSAQLAMECGNKRDYALAAGFFDAGKFYSAYELYTNLGNYLDSVQRAANCAQDYPETGRLYNDSDYSYGNTFIIKAPNDGNYTYIKIYTFDISVALEHPEDAHPLVASVFLAPGKTVKIKLRGLQSYTVKQAYGTTWYGLDDMFGDNGVYSVMTFKNDDGTYRDSLWSDMAFNSYYIYTLTLRQAEGDVTSNPVSREGF